MLDRCLPRLKFLVLIVLLSRAAVTYVLSILVPLLSRCAIFLTSGLTFPLSGNRPDMLLPVGGDLVLVGQSDDRQVGLREDGIVTSLLREGDDYHTLASEVLFHLLCYLPFAIASGSGISTFTSTPLSPSLSQCSRALGSRSSAITRGVVWKVEARYRSGVRESKGPASRMR